MLKQLYQRALPLSVRNRIHPLIHPRITYTERKARSFAKGRVRFGPFKGMKVPEGLGPSLVPVLLGTYELELHPAFERLKKRRFKTIIDVGGGIGYYAVGCALTWPQAKVIAWESEVEYYHHKIEALARANGVRSRIDLRAFCTVEELQSVEHLMPDALIIMDIEGYEAVILDPEQVPGLLTATILVEYHPNMDDNCVGRIRDRFKATHSLTNYEPRHRVSGDFPVPGFDKPALREAARLVITERPIWREGHHGWLLMEPRPTDPTKDAR